MSRQPITHLIIDTFSSDQDYNGNCDYVLVELTPQYVANLLEYMACVARMHRADQRVYCLELWDDHPSWFSCNEQFEALRDVYGNQAGEVPRGEPILLDAAPDFTLDTLERLQQDDCFQRVECQTVQITDDGVSWTCYPKHTDVHIGTAAVHKKTLLTIQRRFGIRECRRTRPRKEQEHG